MEGFIGRIKKLFTEQEVRITAALQLIFCLLAITSAVKKEFRINKKKSRKAVRKQK